MTESTGVVRRRQFCARCGQLMFEYHASPDGHFGLAGDVPRSEGADGDEVSCPTCAATYRLLERLGPDGRPVVRK